MKGKEKAWGWFTPSQDGGDEKRTTKPTPKPKSLSVMGQICKLIPTHMVSKVARETGVDQKARTFSPWSHVVSLMYVQLFHSLSLNDVCDALGMLTGKLQWIRGATVPARNTFSHANRQRNPEMAQRLFWSICNPSFRVLAVEEEVGLPFASSG